MLTLGALGRLGRLGLLASVVLPYWVVNDENPPDLMFDFTLNKAWMKSSKATVAASSLLTVSRASTKYAVDSAGVWSAFSNNLPAWTDLGLSVEEGRTNSALYARDMTQVSAWTASNITPLLNAVGIDGAANSATTLTATNSNGTILQAVSLSGASYSVFLKRVTGTGTVSVTKDGGATWTDVTALLSSSAWYRAKLENVTITSVGIRLGTSGDAVVADFNGAENGTFVTSPILTTNAAIARAADVITVTSPPTFGSAYSMYAKARPQAPAAYTNAQHTLSFSDGTNTNRAVIRRQNGNGNPHVLMAATTGGVSINADVGGASAWSSSSKLAFAVAASDQRAAYAGSLDSNAYSAANLPVGWNTVYFGAGADGSLFWNGLIQQAAIWTSQRVPNAQLQSMTAP